MNSFFSYTIRDGLIDLVDLRQIAKQLETFSWPYVDLLEHRCGGHQPSVWNALLKADAFLLCVTPRVFHSPWVVAECAAALNLKIPIYAASLAAWRLVTNPVEMQVPGIRGCEPSRLWRQLDLLRTRSDSAIRARSLGSSPPGITTTRLIGFSTFIDGPTRYAVSRFQSDTSLLPKSHIAIMPPPGSRLV